MITVCCRNGSVCCYQNRYADPLLLYVKIKGVPKKSCTKEVTMKLCKQQIPSVFYSLVTFLRMLRNNFILIESE
jgi:hypothetical protein